MRSAIALLAAVVLTAPAVAAVKTETVKYQAGETALVGYLAFDDALPGQRPGVIVVHEWWGLNEHARRQAERLAAAGYVAFAIDMYGDGKVTTHPEDAGKWASAIRQTEGLGKTRFAAGYDLLARHPRVRPGELAAIGYCFGGAIVLSMAEAGADLKGVVSFHGALPQEPVAAGTVIRAKILVCHGAADALITADQVATFQNNLTAAGADWQFLTLSGAKHSFTNHHAAAAGMDVLAYNEPADRRSWQAMMSFFAEIFPAP
jgi:dienelactone hydrolase